MYGAIEIAPPRRPAGETELELRLHECDRISPLRDRNSVQLRHCLAQGQIRHVDRHDVDLVRNERPVELPEVRRLQVDYASILTQRAEQLPGARVARVHAASTREEQNPREPACGRAEIERYTSPEVHWKHRQRGLQLRRAAQKG